MLAGTTQMLALLLGLAHLQGALALSVHQVVSCPDPLHPHAGCSEACAKGDCPVGWCEVPDEHKACIKVYSSSFVPASFTQTTQIAAKDYPAAQQACASDPSAGDLHPILASIWTPAANELMAKLGANDTNGLWIGYNDMAGAQGDYYWQDYSAEPIKLWKAGEPAAGLALSQHCAILNITTKLWEPEHCDDVRGYICMRKHETMSVTQPPAPKKVQEPAAWGTKVPSETPTAAWPGTTAAASNAAWPSGSQPVSDLDWPKDAANANALMNCKANEIIEPLTAEDWTQCSGLAAYTPPAAATGGVVMSQDICFGACKDDIDCELAQWNPSTLTCMVGKGEFDCFKSSAHPSVVSRRFQHGKYYVASKLTHVLIDKLRNVGDPTLQAPLNNPAGNLQYAFDRCRHMCVSDVYCEYWQVVNDTTTGQKSCRVEDGQHVDHRIASPLVKGPGVTDSTNILAGEFLQHYCPPQPNKRNWLLTALGIALGALLLAGCLMCLLVKCCKRRKTAPSVKTRAITRSTPPPVEERPLLATPPPSENYISPNLFQFQQPSVVMAPPMTYATAPVQTFQTVQTMPVAAPTYSTVSSPTFTTSYAAAPQSYQASLPSYQQVGTLQPNMMYQPSQ